jgi:lysophospholipase L1-like esterase
MSNKLYKIAIIGNSVALRTRPPQLLNDNQNYGVRLESLLNQEGDAFYLVNNYGFGRATIYEIYLKLDNLIAAMPDLYILNIGIVDASTREVPLWFSNIVTSRKKNIFHNTMRAFHHYIFKRFRPFWVKARGKKSWISESSFKNYYRLIIEAIKKDTHARLILMPINKGNERVEKQIPGTLDNIKQYNKIIRELAFENKVDFLETEDLQSKDFFPDGIQFNAEGHFLIAERLQQLIKKYN